MFKFQVLGGLAPGVIDANGQNASYMMPLKNMCFCHLNIHSTCWKTGGHSTFWAGLPGDRVNPYMHKSAKPGSGASIAKQMAPQT